LTVLLPTAFLGFTRTVFYFIGVREPASPFKDLKFVWYLGFEIWNLFVICYLLFKKIYFSNKLRLYSKVFLYF